jgi:archaetidylinositol phosphate synthase
VLYLLPLVTLSGAIGPFLIAASVGAPLFALWVTADYWRIRRRTRLARDTTKRRMSPLSRADEDPR